MTTSKRTETFSIVNKTFCLAVVFYFLLASTGIVKAQATCDPLPEDPVLLNECILEQIMNPPAPLPPPPGSFADPVSVGGSGARKVAIAYNSIDQNYLIASGNVSGTGNSAVGTIIGSLYDMNNNPIIPPFRIDQGTDVGSPKVIYDPFSNRYLVLTEGRHEGSRGRHIYGRFVNGDGQMPGPHFPVYTSGDAFLNDVDLNTGNNEFIVSIDAGGPQIVIIDQNGGIVNRTNIDPSPQYYNGQNNAAYVPATNELWVAYVETVAVPVPSPGLRPEDNRVYLQRFDASTRQSIGERILISNPQPGYYIGLPSIAYNPQAGEALVAWTLIDPIFKSEIYTRTISGTGVLGPINRTLSSAVDPSSAQYVGQVVTYNPYTNAYQLSAGDDDGNVRILEIAPGGTVLNSEYALARQPGRNTENDYSTNVGVPGAALVGASQGYAKTVVSRTPSILGNYSGGGPSTPRPDIALVDPDTAQIGQVITRVYLMALGAAGVLAMIMIIFGGYMVMTSSGNASQAQKGREYLYSSLIGLILLLSCYVILTTINPDLAGFNLDSIQGLYRNPAVTPPTP